MSDANIKDTFYVFIIILTIYPIIELFFKKHNWVVRLLIAIFIFLFWFISCKYKRIIGREAIKSEQKSDSLHNEITKKDSTIENKVDSNHLFLKRLEVLGVKDSSGFPVKTQNFNINFEKARDVYFGPK